MLQHSEKTMEPRILNAGNENLENGNKIKMPFIITWKHKCLRINLNVWKDCTHKIYD